MFRMMQSNATEAANGVREGQSMNHSRRFPLHIRATASLLAASVMLTSFTGCSRRFWREQAENDSYRAVAEKLNDERWLLPRINLTPDERSRFYDPYDPDQTPLPPDDPAAHKFMHCSNGHEGYKRWHAFGDTLSVENPNWLEPYTHLLNEPDPTKSHGEVKIPRVTLQDSLELTYIHSREYQNQLEEVYLSALELTEQRYELGLRFLVGGGGSGTGGALFNSSFRPGASHQETLETGLGITQTLASGTQLSVELINAFTWNVGSNSSAARLAWSVTQPLLNQAGRKVVLEALTQAERTLLYEVRLMARFRQTLFTSVASDYLSLQQSAQTIINQLNNIRQLEEQIEAGQVEDSWQTYAVKEELEEMPDGVEIPESLAERLDYDGDWLIWYGEMTKDHEAEILAVCDDVSYQNSAQQLIRWRKNEVVSLNVLQLITQLNEAQNRLEGSRRQLADDLDSFKIRLGLPPNVEMTVDDSFLQPFELIDNDLLSLADSLKDFARNSGPGLIPAPRGSGADVRLPPGYDDLREYVDDLAALRTKVRVVALDSVKSDFEPVRDILKATDDESLINPNGRDFGSVDERKRVIRDIARDLRLYRISEQDYRQWDRGIRLLQDMLTADDSAALLASLDADGDEQISASELPMGWRDLPRIKKLDKQGRAAEKLDKEDLIAAMRDSAISIREKLLQVVLSLEVVQAGLRVEQISLNRFTLPDSEKTPTIDEVIQVGLQNRHDLMNAKAAVMDSRRALEVAANALKARLDVDVGGSNGLSGGVTDNVDVTVNFKTPIDQVTERNAYNQALIAYQRARRSYMETEDEIKQDIRSSWRQLMVAEQRLEIDRQTVRNAALEYDSVVTSSSQNNNLSLLRALGNVLNAQNSLVNDWVSYETNRLNIFRDMGIMQIDSNGVWQDEFYLRDGSANIEPFDVPPETTELTPVLEPAVSPDQFVPSLPANAATDAAPNLPEIPIQ